MGGGLERSSRQGTKGREMLRPARTGDAAAGSRSWPQMAAKVPIANGLSPAARDLPLPDTICHDLPRTASFERSFSWCESGRVEEMELGVLVDVSGENGIRAEGFAGGISQARGPAQRKDGAKTFPGLTPSATSIRPTLKQDFCVTSPAALRETSGRKKYIVQPVPGDCRGVEAGRTTGPDSRHETGRTLLGKCGTGVAPNPWTAVLDSR